MFAGPEEGVCCCTSLRQTAFRNHPGCAQTLITKAKRTGEELPPEMITEAQVYATYGSPEVLRVLLQLGHPDHCLLFTKVVRHGNIKCIKVALHAKIAVSTWATNLLLRTGTVELYNLARQLGYPCSQSVLQPIVEGLVADFKRKGCPQLQYEYLGQVPEKELLCHAVKTCMQASKRRR
jgi:hypothetical protein